ncbi:MAG: F0F1 ATP synthase subunit A [Verrucomicrobiales bacterium]|nr:F0F1 ATP synthase subunit A [Verrucomicrobiales bacterium]
MDFILSLSITDSIYPLFAAGLAPGALPGLGWFTNSIFFALIVTASVLIFTRMATKRMETIPGKKQNFVEYIVEFLYTQVESIVGHHVAPKVFPLLATIFIFVLASNWAGLIPGVGTVGFAGGEEYMSGPLTIKADAGHAEHHGEDTHGAHGEDNADHSPDEHHIAPFTPLLRPPTTDLNFTLALACVFMIVWAWVTFKEVGIKGFIEHTFAPKGGLEGAMKWALLPIFMLVGVIELISIAARPVSLSLRLFGNVFAGETLLHSMMALGKQLGLGGVPMFIASVIVPLPFYFMEILVGVLQATVFALLCAVFVKLSTAHEEAH